MLKAPVGSSRYAARFRPTYGVVEANSFSLWLFDAPTHEIGARLIGSQWLDAIFPLQLVACNWEMDKEG